MDNCGHRGKEAITRGQIFVYILHFTIYTRYVSCISYHTSAHATICTWICKQGSLANLLCVRISRSQNVLYNFCITQHVLYHYQYLFISMHVY